MNSQGITTLLFLSESHISESCLQNIESHYSIHCGEDSHISQIFNNLVFNNLTIGITLDLLYKSNSVIISFIGTPIKEMVSC